MSGPEIIKMEYCRLCQINEGTYKFKNDKNFIRQIYKCTNIELNDDSEAFLPSKVCADCRNKILDINTFSEHVKKTDSYLRRLLSQTASPQSLELQSPSGSDQEERNTYKCEKCPASFTEHCLLENHEESHQVKVNHECPVCKKCYNRSSSFEKHKKCHKELYCSKCKQTFNDYISNESHNCIENIIDTEKLVRKKFRKNKVKKKSENEDLGVNRAKCETLAKISQKEESFKCDTCGKHFHNNNSFKAHKNVHRSDFTCPRESCNKICTTAYALKVHQLNHDGKRPYLCVTCGKGFMTKNSLTCHERIHADVKGYVCKICNIGFSVKSNLRAHEKTYHEGVRFYCSQCTKAFVTKCSLERHERIHTGVKEFKCKSCPAAFYTNKELVKHQIYHLGIKQHKCDECFKTFFERHHLIIHLRTHTGERPYVCKISGCGKSFVDSQKLKRHSSAKHTTIT